MEHKKPREHSITWHAPEFLYKKKTPIWYTHVSVFFFAVFVVFFLLQQWVSVAIVCFLFWLFISRSNDRPDNVTYTINRSGITIGERQLDYSEIRSFSVDTRERQPIILLNVTHYFAFPVTMVVKKEHLEESVDYLVQFIPLEQTFSFTHWLTHWLHY